MSDMSSGMEQVGLTNIECTFLVNRSIEKFRKLTDNDEPIVT